MIEAINLSFNEYVQFIAKELKNDFKLTYKELDEVITYYMDNIVYSFYDGTNTNTETALTFIQSIIKDNKLKWKR
jgi:hypothetical protein